MTPQDRLTVHIRLTPSLIRQLKIAAADAGRSMNAEIAARLERSFGPDDENRLAAINLLNEALLILDQGSEDWS